MHIKNEWASPHHHATDKHERTCTRTLMYKVWSTRLRIPFMDEGIVLYSNCEFGLIIEEYSFVEVNIIFAMYDAMQNCSSHWRPFVFGLFFTARKSEEREVTLLRFALGSQSWDSTHLLIHSTYYKQPWLPASSQPLMGPAPSSLLHASNHHAEE